MSLIALCGCRSGGEATRDHRRHVVFLYPTEDNRPLIDGLVSKFEASHNDIHIEIRAVPGNQYEAKIKTLVAAGEPPDVFVCGDVTFAYLRPFVADLNSFAERDSSEIDFDDYFPEIRRAFTLQGHIYFLPETFNVSLLYYNKTLFQQAHEPYPTANWGWDEYSAAATRLTRRNANGEVKVWGSTVITGWWGEWLTLVHGAGGDLFNKDVTRCELDTPEAVQGLTFYRNTILKGGFAPAPGEGPSTGFRSNQVAMEFGGHTGEWKSYAQLPDLSWDIEALPKGPSGRRGGEISLQGLGASKKSKELEASWQFIKFMSSKQSIEAYVKFGYPSVRRSIAAMPFYADQPPLNKKALAVAMDSAEPIPASPDFMEIALDLVQPEIDRMLTDGATPRATAAKATEAANAFLRATTPDRTP